MSPNLVKALRLFKETDVTSMTEIFGSGGPEDYQWIPHVARNEWVIVTCDFAMGRGLGQKNASVEAKILHAYRAKVFFMPRGYSDYGILRKVQCFFNAWPEIKAKGLAAKPGDVFDVADNGTITQRAFSVTGTATPVPQPAVTLPAPATT